MKLMYKQDIFKSGCEALVNPVNTVGVMGAGLALAFKKKYPNNFDEYKQKCMDGFDVNTIFITVEDGKFIVNFPTKLHWKDPSQIGWIKTNLVNLREWCITNKIKSVAIPKLGCGLGGLSWSIVKPIILEIFENIDITVVLFD